MDKTFVGWLVGENSFPFFQREIPDELVDDEIEKSLLDSHDCGNSSESGCDCVLLDKTY